MKTTQKDLSAKISKEISAGFTIVETLLVILILAVVGFGGYYVWHNQHAKTATVAISAPAKPATSSTKYFTIKEWGVQAPYDGTLVLTYKLSDSGTADFSSTELSAATDGKCNNYGGHILRMSPDDPYGFGSETAAQVASDPSSSLTNKHIGNYYYFFMHDQALCPNISDPNSSAADIQGSAEKATEAIVSNLQAIAQ